MLITMLADRFDAGGVLRAKGTQVDVATELALRWIGDNAAAAVGTSRETAQGIRKDVPVLQDRISGTQQAGDAPVSDGIQPNVVTATETGVVLVVDPVEGYAPAPGELVLRSVVDGLPKGGATGQVIVKLSNADYDYAWATISGGALVSTTNYAAEVMVDAPFAFWPLAEASGNALDAARSLYPGTPNGTITRLAGLSGLGGAQMTTFGAGGHFITSTLGSFATTLGGGVTVEFVFKGTNTEVKQAVLGAVNTGTATAIGLELNSGTSGTLTANALNFFVRNNYGTSRVMNAIVPQLFDGNTHHVVAVIKPNSVADDKLYIDGVEVTSYVAKPNGVTNTTYSNYGFPLAVGALNSRGTISQHIVGSLGGVAIYNKALSAERVATHRSALMGIL